VNGKRPSLGWGHRGPVRTGIACGKTGEYLRRSSVTIPGPILNLPALQLMINQRRR
jgi:hypothetical protein